MFRIRLCCSDMHEPLLTVSCALNQDAGARLVRNVYRWCQSGNEGRREGCGDERDVKHDNDEAGTAEDFEARHQRMKASHRSPKAEVRECNLA